MNAPKNWDGVTQIGSALVRGLQSLDTPVGTSFGQELRDNGLLGDVTVKKVLGFSSTHRSHEAPTPEGFPFLSSWQASSVFLLDEKLSYQKRVFNSANAAGLEVIGNCHFIGDGFSVGTARTATSAATVYGVRHVRAQDIEVLLMRLPHPGAAVPAEDYLKASASERKKLSVRIPLESFVKTLGEIYTLPLGWKNETAQYAFAVVVRMASDLSGSPYLLPRVWVGDTGTMKMVETTLPVPADWSWASIDWADASSTSYKSQIHCTASGRLEMVLARHDRYRIASYTFAQGMTIPSSWRYTDLYAELEPCSAVFTEAPPPPGYPAPNWAAVYIPIPATQGFVPYIDAGTNADATAHRPFAVMHPLRQDVFLIRSEDFGTTWATEHASAFQSDRPLNWPARDVVGPKTPDEPSSYLYPVGDWYVRSLFGDPAPPKQWIDYNPVTIAGLPGDALITVLGAAGWHERVGQVGIGYLVRPPYIYNTFATTGFACFSGAVVPGNVSHVAVGEGVATTWTPAPIWVASRGRQETPAGQLATLVGAGTITFALLAARTPIAAAPDDATGTFGVSSPRANTSFFMYRRVGAAPFERISWPGEVFSLTDFGVFEVAHPAPIQPIAWIGSIHEWWGLPDTANPYTNAWASTGEGRAAFFFASGFTYAGGSTMDNNMPITMIATADGGATWVTRTILNSLNFRESCVLAADTKGPVEKRRGATILYVEIDTTPGPTFGRRQLMRISEDFTTTAKYGRPYPVPPRAGIINFQRYVHPGFPGLYDGPEAQPPATP